MGKNLSASAGGTRDIRSIPGPGRLPGESRGQRSPTGYSPWGQKESETTDHTAQQLKIN